MLKAHMTAEQIQLREGLEPTLVANEIARAVALGEGLPETFFDYGCVPQESRAEVYELTKSVKDARGSRLAVIVEISGTLRRAKELLGHGNFLPWLKAEFRCSARNYMSLAAHFQDKTANFCFRHCPRADRLARRSGCQDQQGQLRSRHATAAASDKACQCIASRFAEPPTKEPLPT